VRDINLLPRRCPVFVGAVKRKVRTSGGAPGGGLAREVGARHAVPLRLVYEVVNEAARGAATAGFVSITSVRAQLDFSSVRGGFSSV